MANLREWESVEMSELLTTGEMIDRLKGREIAESVDGHIVERLAHGEILSIKDNVHHSAVVLTEPFLKTKWRILPNYVSFAEAMQALKDAKAVYFHDGDWKGRIIYGQWLEDSEIKGYTFAQLINGKWTIQEG